MQIPLCLAWTVRIHKLQGLTLQKVKLGLGKKEFSTGLIFIGLLHVKRLDVLLIVDSLDYSHSVNLTSNCMYST